MKYKRVITYGTFDMLHVGHLNILRRAKQLGDYLVVGVTSEDYDRHRGKLHVIQDLQTRIGAIKQLDFVDEVIVESHSNQKQEDIVKYKIDAFIIGDDWLGKFDYLKEYCQVEYLPRTEGISSTLLRAQNHKIIRMGIIGSGRIAKRFAVESLHVPSVEIKSVYSRNIRNVEDFVHANNIEYGFDDLDDFFNSGIDAIYIASPHEYHYEHAKKALLSKKHVLCEKPIVLEASHLDELIAIAKNNNLVLLEAIKTAFLPAFSKLLEQIDNGIIGNVVDLRATFTKIVVNRDSREWKTHGGAINELASYPLLLAHKVLGEIIDFDVYSHLENDIDMYSNIIVKHKDKKISILTVGIGAKSEGCAIISGTKGYIYIPAPWWLTKSFFIRFEDPTKEIKYSFDYDGDGLRYELAEFISLIHRDKIESNMLSQSDMKKINLLFSQYNSYLYV